MIVVGAILNLLFLFLFLLMLLPDDTDVESEDVTFVIEAGGTSEWQNDYFEDGAMTRFVVNSEGMEAVDTFPAQNMGDAAMNCLKTISRCWKNPATASPIWRRSKH